MNIQFPLHTVIFIVFNMVFVGVFAARSLSQSFSRLAISPVAKRRWQATVIISLMTWFVARILLGHGRVIAPARLVLISSLSYSLGFVLTMLSSPTFRQAALSIPQEKLIGFQSVRVVGFVFLALFDMRLLPAQFALPAGYGDILVGLGAPFVVHSLKQNKPFARKLAIAWNWLGLLDFAIALVTGFTFIAPHVRQVARSGHSIAYLDYVLMIPGLAVPILMSMHIISLMGLRNANDLKGNLTPGDLRQPA